MALWLFWCLITCVASGILPVTRPGAGRGVRPSTQALQIQGPRFDPIPPRKIFRMKDQFWQRESIAGKGDYNVIAKVSDSFFLPSGGGERAMCVTFRSNADPTTGHPDDIALVVTEFSSELKEDDYMKPIEHWPLDRAVVQWYETDKPNQFFFDGMHGTGVLASLWSNIDTIALSNPAKRITPARFLDDTIMGTSEWPSFPSQDEDFRKYDLFARTSDAFQEEEWGKEREVMKLNTIFHVMDWKQPGRGKTHQTRLKTVRAWDIKDLNNPRIIKSSTGTWDYENPGAPLFHPFPIGGS
ncbi:MAG: hypothetical protein M1833_002061 [Piccolia ochrophora]|nr:MAG: hypothetical protein M1833_002061 [Piccolia ochrophora]